MQKYFLRTLGATIAAAAVTGSAAAQDCASARGGAGPARSAASAFVATLSAEQRTAAVRSFGKADAIRWSNLPLSLAPRVGVRLGDLTPGQTHAAEALLRTALSSCGVKLLGDIRAADAFLKPLDNRKIGWDPANYFIAFIGDPAAGKPWSLKVDGHHLAYNITFDAPQVSATPLFDGTDPVEFKLGDRSYEPLALQAGAMRRLATAVAGLPAAKLAGEFRDVTRGATDGGDANFPISYPVGANERGVAYAALTPGQQALVRAAMERWVELPNGAISGPLMATYSAPGQLAQTYVGVSGSSDLSMPGSYVRIDGPRVWIEFIVQPAAGQRAGVHYHTIWRDKLADYGGAFGR